MSMYLTANGMFTRRFSPDKERHFSLIELGTPLNELEKFVKTSA